MASIPAQYQAGAVRTVRVADDVWEAARRRADLEGVSLGYAMRQFALGYATGHLHLPKTEINFDNSQPEHIAQNS